jgi:formyltetrahydrofolate deformylase
MDIDVVISNHETLRPVAETFHIPFHVLAPITPETKDAQEAKQLELLKNVDVVVLARYMQVLSENFLNQFPDSQIINIHHSFLPAFMGRKPYHQAWERGVKLIGATAHYATLALDDGPIIEQDVTQVTHRDEVKDLLRKGRILERNVLLKALEAHLDDRVIVHKNRCVVFGD